KKAVAVLRDKLNFFENSPAIRDAVGQLLMQDAADGSQRDPNRSESRLGTQTEDRSQKYAEAAAILRQASALAPEEQPIREHYGMALYYNKQYREAESVLERLLNQKSEDRSQKTDYNQRADIHTVIGECQMEIDQLRDARDHFELASQLDPAAVSGWLNLAKVALRLNDLKRAEISLKKAMTLTERSQNSEVRSQNADANLLMGYLRLRQAEDGSQKT